MLGPMALWHAMVFLVVAGCGASKKEPIDFGESLEPRDEPAPALAPAPSTAPALPAATCAEAGANVSALTVHVSPALGAAVGTRCQSDGWAPEVVQCFAAALDGPGLSLCMALLPAEQRKAIETQSVTVVRASEPACDRLLQRKPASGDPAAEVPRVPGAPTVAMRTIGGKELEQLRLSGQTQIEPSTSERLLMEQCGVSRLVVSLKVCMDAAGVPSGTELVSASRLPDYEARLIAAVSQWRYRPYVAESRPSAVCGPVTFAFAAAP